MLDWLLQTLCDDGKLQEKSANILSQKHCKIDEYNHTCSAESKK